MRHFPAVSRVPIDDIVSVNGVGDTFLGVLVAGLAQGLEILDERLIELAQRAAILTLKCSEAVAPEVADLRKELEKLGKGGEWNDRLTTSHYVDR
jgi:pseudouridylate synthase / pseudouridine kinase